MLKPEEYRRNLCAMMVYLICNMTLVLKDNSPEIREEIKKAGIELCKCAEFENAIWLDFTNHNGVHGVGYSDETEGNLSVEQVLKNFTAENQDAVYFTSVYDFIFAIKQIKK